MKWLTNEGKGMPRYYSALRPGGMLTTMDRTQTSQSDWQAAIRNVYDIFAGCRRPSTMEASYCRDAAEIMRDLSSAPLAKLSENRLGPYADSALTTAGSEDDYKYFLPRIIELMSRPTVYMGFDPVTIAGKLTYANYKSWPTEQQDVLRAAFRATFLMTCRQPHGLRPVSDLLIANAAVGNDIQPLLDSMLPAATAEVVLHLADLIQDAANNMRYWAEMPQDACIKLRAWMAGDAISEALMAGVDLVDRDDVRDIETALDHLSLL